VTALPGQDLDAIEAVVDEELARLLAEGPNEDELALARTQYRAGFIRGIERIGGFGGKSDVLAMNEVFAGDPAFYRTRLELTATVSADELRSTAVEWLSDGEFVLEVHPYSEGEVIATGVDRSRVPDAGPPPAARFPEVERATLSNGLEIVLARRDAVPLVSLQLMVDAGSAADALGTPGTANLAMTMLDEGTSSRDALQISEEIQRLGATLTVGSNLDASIVSMSALRENLRSSMDLFADVILNPSFPEADFERLRTQVLVQIQQESVDPFSMALRVLPKLLYGEGHPYALPLKGTGTTEGVTSLTTDDLARFHATWFKPNNAKLLVVGSTTMDELAALAEDVFGDWRRGDAPEKRLPVVEPEEGQAVYIMDRADAVQSMIVGGHIAPPMSDPDNVALTTVNTVFGGNFTARINMNLREDKGWSYGAASIIYPARGQRTFLFRAPVQSDKTRESVQELVNELAGIVSDSPITSDELDLAVNNQTLTLPGLWETNDAVLTSIFEMEQFGLPDDHFDTLADRINGLTLEQLNEAARRLIQPKQVVWIVVGDKESIEEGLKDLELGPVYEIDADGNIIGQLIN